MVSRWTIAVSVDYRLLTRFIASRERFEAARLALPERWRNDARREAIIINKHWVRVIAHAAEHAETSPDEGPPETPIAVLTDDRYSKRQA